MLSVCMTTYNGSKYVREQLDSIIKQLNVEDELLIQDDGSTDGTIDILELYQNRYTNVSCFVNEHNLGHVRNFESLINKARKSIVVLSDQDDIWNDDKLHVIREVFGSDSELTLYHHSFELIDECGEKKDSLLNFSEESSLPKARNYSKSSKIIKLRELFFRNHYYGCCMAFKREMMMPFPKCAYAHDHFIALTNILNGNVLCEYKKLICYRIHDENVTPKKKNSLITKLTLRIKLVFCLFYIILRGKYV